MSSGRWFAHGDDEAAEAMSITPAIPPFAWPDPRISAGVGSYAATPPYGQVPLVSGKAFGTVSGLTGRGIALLDEWMSKNPELVLCLVVITYPTCATRRSDLLALRDLTTGYPSRLLIRIHPLHNVSDRGTNALCCLPSGGGKPHVVIGATDDLGLASSSHGHVNMVLHGEVTLVDSFRRWFDYIWAHSGELTAAGVTDIPELVLPRGDPEAAILWQRYAAVCASAGHEDAEQVSVDVATGEVSVADLTGDLRQTATQLIDVPILDPLADRVARLYAKGALVSIDKLSRIPPLATPIDPRMFGDHSELQLGNVNRKVTMRVSVIDETTLKAVEKHRQGLRLLLAKFSFALADSVRWVPLDARTLLEAEVKRLNEEGQKFITNLLKDGADALVDARRPTLVTDLQKMHRQLGGTGEVDGEIVDNVVRDLKSRLKKAQVPTILPLLTYTQISFDPNTASGVSPWTQAFEFVSDVAALPRKMLTDQYFFRGITTERRTLMHAMDIAGDHMIKFGGGWHYLDQAKDELTLLTSIEEAAIEPRKKCEFVFKLIDGSPLQDVHGALEAAVAA